MLLTNWLRSIANRCRSPRSRKARQTRQLQRRASVLRTHAFRDSLRGIEELEDQTMLTTMISIDDVEVIEESTNRNYPTYARLTVTRTGETIQDMEHTVYVSYTTVDGTATSDSDYEETSGYFLMYSQYLDVLTQTATILVEIDIDSIPELDETFQVKLTSASGYDVVLGDDTGTVTIVDDDRNHLWISDVTVNEGAGTAAVTVSMDRFLDSFVSVDYTTADIQTATSPQDYEAASGTITFEPNSLNKTIEINIVDDGLFELDEAFYVELSNLQSDTITTKISDDRAVVTIEDNDRSFPIHYFDFEEQGVLSPPAGTSPDSDSMGFALAADGNTLIATTPYWSDPYQRQGAAFVYVRNDQGTPRNRLDDTWDYQATLLAPDGQETDYFGWSVALSGDTAVIGARQGKPDGDESSDRPGSAYVFTRSGTTWTFQQELNPSDGGFHDEFGRSVAIEGDTIMVGMDGGFISSVHRNGAVYVFNRVNDVWSETQIIDNPDSGTNERFASKIDFEGTTLVVNAYLDNDNDNNQGAVYVYNLLNGQWIFSQTLKPETPVTNGQFGFDISLENNELLIGAPARDAAGDIDGNAFLYRFDAGLNEWVLEQTLSPDDVQEDKHAFFGSSVLLQDGMMFIGSRNYDANFEFSDGALYHYWKEGSDWKLHERFSTPQDPAELGFSDYTSDIALSGGALFYFDDHSINHTGTIYSFLSPETPVIGIKDTVIAEGDDSSRLVSIEVTRTGYQPGDLNAPATVFFNTIDGTATVADGLYQAVTGSLTFAADPTAVTQTQTFTVEIAGDTIVEPDDRDFTVSLYSVTGNGVIIDGEAVITIAEDDQAIVSAEDVTVNEGDGSIVIPVTLSKPVDHDVYVYYDLSNLTTVPIDYEDQQGVLYFAAGTQSQQIEVAIADDNLTEFTEQFQLDLNFLQAGGYNVIIADEPAKVTILDNDQTVLSLEDVSFDEANPPRNYVSIKTWLSKRIDGIISATAEITNLSSTISGESELDDYYFSYGTNIKINNTREYLYITLFINNDDYVEPDEKFRISLTNIQIDGIDIEDAGIDFVLGDIEAEVAIVDDDQASLTISDTTVNEDAGTAAVTVTLDQIVEGEISVDYATVGQSAEPDTDFLSTAGTLTFAQGEQSKTIHVPIVDSNLIEGDETLLVSLSNFVNQGLAVTLDKTQGVITIKDDEQAALSINDVTVNEDAGTATLTVTLDQAVATPVSVDFATSDQTATSTEDYLTTSGTLTFNPGDLTQTITVSIVDSPAVEADERLLVNLSHIQANNANISLADAQGEILIHDDESATISIADISVDEGAGVATLTVSLDQPVEADFSIDYTTSDQSAQQSDDYQNTTGTLSFSAGEQTKTFNISLVDSDLVELDETFLVTLSNIQAAGADLSFSDDQAQVTIHDDDQAGVSVNDTVVNEGAGTVDITVSLDKPVYTSVTVDYSTTSQSASATDDYLTRTGTLTFNPGEQSKTITVAIVDSPVLEGDETFLLNLANLQSTSTEVYLADGQGEVTIHDDEQATLSIEDLQVNEDAGTATLTVTLSQASSIPVNVDYATADQSATDNYDYLSTSGTLTFNPGDLIKTITVSLVNSATPEPDETFLVNLNNIQASNANVTLADGQAQVTIRDDQTAISINDVTVDEDAGTALLTVSLNHTISENLSVDYATADQTAKQPGDYQATAGTLAFNAGELTKTISIPLVYTDAVEKTESFLVNLSNIQVTGTSVVFADAQGRVTIQDHDQASLTISDTTVNESAGTVTLTVSLDHPVETYLNLDYTTTAGPYATSPEYFEATSGTLIFLPGQTTATIEVNLVDNNYVEPEVYFYVDISNLNSGGTPVSITDSRAKVTIEDNDQDFSDRIYDFGFYQLHPYGYLNEINASEYVSNSDQFSFKAAADGDIMVSTAPFLDAPLSDQGGAYVYVRNSQGTPGFVFDDTWDFQATLLAPDAQAADHFGWSVDVSGDTAVIGALNVDSTENNGAVYIFTRSGSTWSFQQKLTPESADSNLQFGTAVSIEGNTLVVGATQDHNGTGAVHIYKRVSGVWSLFQSISNPDSFGFNAEFGSSIDIENRNLVIGAPQHDGGTGAVYVFNQIGYEPWTLKQKLSSPTPVTAGFFGISVSIENDELAIGEPGALQAGKQIGKAYLYQLASESDPWSLEQTIAFNYTFGEMRLGTQVLLQDGMLFITAADDYYFYNDQPDNAELRSGLVLQYLKDGSDWVLKNELGFDHIDYSLEFEDEPYNQFGHQIALADGALFVSAPFADDLGTDTGTIYNIHPGGPQIVINPVAVTEGDNGTKTVTVEMTRSALNPGDLSVPATVDYHTADGTAVAGVDYQSTSGTLYFSADPTALTQTQTFTVEILGDTQLEVDKYFSISQTLVLDDGRRRSLSSGRVTITNDDQAAVSITDETVNEGDGTVTLTVTLDKEVPTDVSLHYTTVADTAIRSSDYWKRSGDLTFAAGELSKTITVPLINSPYTEPDQRFYVELSDLQSDASGIIIAKTRGEVTIIDDDPALLTLGGSSYISENTTNPTLRLYLTNKVETTVSVDYATADDMATSPDDYQSISGTAVFDPLEQNYYIDIPFVDTDLVELNEKILLNLTNLQTGGSNVTLSINADHFYISNDDQASLSIGDTVVNEAAGTATVTVTLDHPVDTSITVDYATAGQTADPTSDFLTKSGTLTFAPEELTKTISFSIVDSNLVEGDETFLVNLTNLQAAGRDVTLADDQATITIQDDDQANLSIDDISVNEDAGTATLTVSLDRPVGIGVNVDYATTNASAIAGDDFVSTSGTLTIDANHLTGTITIPITDTDLVELEETFLVNLSNIQANGANIVLADSQGEVTIADDDQAALSIADVIADENSGTAIVTVSLDHPVNTSVSIDFSTADQSAIQSQDYQSTSGTVVFTPGQQTQTLTIPLIDTEILERDETFLVNLANLQASGYDVVLADDQAVVTIGEDQAAFSISDAVVDETAGTATVTVTLDKAVDTTISVDYATTDQSAISPDDYLSQSGTLTFYSGELTKTITVSIVDTDAVEGDEHLLINLFNIQSSDRNVVLGDGQGDITIRDDDLTTMSINDVTVNEDAGTATLTVSLGQIVTTAVNVDYATINNSAIAGDDFTSTSGTLTIDAGNLTGTFTIPIIDTDLVEGQEKFLVNLTNISSNNANLFFIDSQGSVTITDNDQAGISINDVTVDEIGKTASLTVSLDKQVVNAVSVFFSTADQSAVQTEDYLSRAGTITFAAGEQTKTITFSIVNTDLVELEESFLVNLSNIQANDLDVVFTDDQGKVTIRDGDQASLRIDNNTFSEDEGIASVKVSLDHPVGTVITVDYTTVDDSATSSDDFQATSGTLTFNPGEVEKYIDVPLINSAIPEFNESFHVKLSNFQTNDANVLLGHSNATILIVDNAYGISIFRENYRIPDASTLESNDITLAVELNQSISSSFTVDYSTTDLTAIQSEDYQATSGTLQFLPGETIKYITIPIISSEQVENDESFLVTLSNLQPTEDEVSIVLPQAEVTIRDNDQATINITDKTVHESDGTVDLIVTLDQPVDTSITVDYATADSNAENPTDYLSQSGTLTFAAGEVSKTITLSIVDTDDVENTESFKVNLSNIQSSGRDVRMGDSQAYVTIIDDDKAKLFIEDISANEGEGTATLTVSLDKLVDSVISVDFATVANASADETDYQTTSGTINFSHNQLTQTITIPLVNDELVEGDETFLVNLSNVQSYLNVVLGDSQAEVTIQDDDQGTVSIDDISVNENEHYVYVTISLDKEVDYSVYVDIDSADGTANSSDYAGRSTSITFRPGDHTKTVSFYIRDSDQVESDETFLVNATKINAYGRNVVAGAPGTVTIIDDDQAFASIGDVSVDEAAGTAIVAVTLSRQVDTSITLDYATADQSALHDEDYLTQSGTVTINPYQLSASFTIPVYDSSIIEGDETFLVNLSNLQTNGRNVVLIDDQAVITIRDEIPTISIHDVTVNESLGTASLTVSLDQTVPDLVTVDWSTEAQSAIDGLDFLGSSGTLTFQPGEVTQTISVPLIKSDSYEAEETFLVNLTNLQSAGMDVLFGDAQAEVTISDFTRGPDDQPVPGVIPDELSDFEFQSKILKPGTTEEEDHFGSRIATDGDTMITSTPFNAASNSIDGPATIVGGEQAAYVYVRNRNGTYNDPADDTWQYQATLSAPAGLPSDSLFGHAVAISGSTAVVADYSDNEIAPNSGALYVYRRSGYTWSLEQKIKAPGSYRNFYFGRSVAIENGTIVAGATGFDGANDDEGAVFVFERVNNVWTAIATLEAADATYGQYFGSEVAIDGRNIAVGVPGHSVAGAWYSGCVYIFSLSNGSWTQTQQILPEQERDNGNFGTSIAIDGNNLVIGATGHYTADPGSPNVFSKTGAAYIYSRVFPNNWILKQSLQPSIRAADDFGIHVDIQDDVLVVGDRAVSNLSIANGNRYIYRLDGSEWVEQQTIDGTNSLPLTEAFAIADGQILFSYPGDSDQAKHGGSILVYYDHLLAEITIQDVTITEGDDGTRLVTVQIIRRAKDQGGLIIPALIDFSTLDGTATALGGDYVAKTGTIRFDSDPVAKSQTKIITIEISGDTQLESDEEFYIELSNAIANAKIVDSTGIVTIANDDFASISIDDVTVSESDQTADLTVTLDQALSFAVSVDYSTADLAALKTEDYEFTTGTLTFNPGETTQTITIPLVDLALVEDDESFLVNLSNLQASTDFITISDTQAKVTIIDDDQAQVSINDLSVDEETGFATVTVSLDQPVDGTVTLDYATADGTALSGADYQTTSGTLTFNQNQLTQTITIPIINTNLVEDVETFLINLNNIQAGGRDVIFEDNQSEITITDSDQPAFSIDDVNVNEDAGTAVVTVTLDQPLTSDVSVDFSTADDSATSGSDYQQQSGTLTFDPGETTQTIQISIIDSGLLEPDETFLINLTNPQSSVYQPILTDAQAIVTIGDDDPGSISINDIVVDENAGTAVLTVSLDREATTAFSVDYATADGTASSGSDYQSKSGTLTFNPGDTTQTIEITLVDSDLIEADETFLVNLSNLQAAGLDVSLSDSQGQVTIHDDDQASLSVQNLTVDEDAGTAQLTISLDQALLTNITVDFETLDGTALAGSDFSTTSGTLTFNPGETTQTISLTILDDSLLEATESFFVKLSNLQQNGSPVDLGNDQAEITIWDNDQAKLSINDIEVNEDIGTASLTVSLDKALETSFTIDYQTGNDTAVVDSDYLLSSGTQRG
ncbi:Calx-beta domain protein [Gimesia panareensis]|uniref:Calx-beta domain protein n=1 Tax=Gimesia panareensis TaxID=2527978 RepID=A0A518FLU0_9PLAN|nr:Calx-beta domain-containing protein [Gimesia panareensis]QDV17336.1 Calx-beta domain protein [Gimesia panareensis]